MHDDRPALVQPIGQGVAAPPADGNREVRIIRQGGAHDRHGKAFLTVRVQQTFLARDLVAGILPVWVVQRRRFSDQIVRRRLLICRGGADEDVLLDPAAEERQVALDILRRVGDPVDDDIERHVLQGGARVRQIVYVGSQALAPGQICGPRAAIEQIELEAVGDRLPTDRRADEAGAADEQNSHSRCVLSVRLYADVDLCLPTSHSSRKTPIYNRSTYAPLLHTCARSRPSWTNPHA